MSRAIVWSKNNCIYCSKAKAVLDQKDVSYEERNVEGPDWTPEQFFEAVPPGTHCPFCGSNLAWGERGGYDASEYDNDEDRMDA